MATVVIVVGAKTNEVNTFVGVDVDVFGTEDVDDDDDC